MAVDEEKSDEELNLEEEDKEEYESITVSEVPNEYDEQMDMYEEKEAKKEAIMKFKQAKLDDETDTPQDTLAKDRF